MNHIRCLLSSITHQPIHTENAAKTSEFHAHSHGIIYELTELNQTNFQNHRWRTPVEWARQGRCDAVYVEIRRQQLIMIVIRQRANSHYYVEMLESLFILVTKLLCPLNVFNFEQVNYFWKVLKHQLITSVILAHIIELIWNVGRRKLKVVSWEYFSIRVCDECRVMFCDIVSKFRLKVK